MKIFYMFKDVDTVTAVPGQQIKYCPDREEGDPILFREGVVIEIIPAKSNCDYPKMKLRDCETSDILTLPAWRCDPDEVVYK